MPRPRNVELDGLMDTIMQMDSDKIPIADIHGRLNIQSSQSTLKRRLRAWRQDTRVVVLSADEEERIKQRIPELVFDRLCGDRELFATLCKEGYKIGSIWKVRQLRRAAGIPRRHHTADDAEYDMVLRMQVQQAFDEGRVEDKGMRHVYQVLRRGGLMVPQQRLERIMRLERQR